MGKNSSEGNNTWIWIVCAIVIVVVVIILALKGCGTKTYNVSFDTDGGSTVSSLKVKEDGTITRPSNPTKEGYEFAGWYLNGERYDFNTKVTGDITLEARWNKIEEEEKNGLELGSTKTTITLGDSETIKVTQNGDAKGQKLVWKSSDEKIATVDSNGKIKALKEGKVTITVTTEDGKYSAECVVTVSKKESTPTISITISGEKSVKVGETITLKANVTPKDAKVEWTSSDKNVATVDANGIVKGMKAGTVTIKATATDSEGNNKSASIKVTVKEKQDTTASTEEVKTTEVTLNKNSLELKKGEKGTLTATVKPENHTDKVTITWSTNNAGVATVDGNGNVTAVGKGNAEITVTVKTAEGKTYTAKCTVTVTETVVEPVYKVVVELLYTQENLTSYKYSVTLLKDGKGTTDYKGIIVGDVTYKPTNGTLSENQVERMSGKKATVVLSDGTEVKNVDVQIIK